MRVILHPGFHKTGTSSLQACLAANRAALLPYARIVLLDELNEAFRFSTHYCLEGDPFDLAGFTASFARICEGLADEGHDTLIFSCEGLSGRPPGKRGVEDYRAAVPLAAAMAAAVKGVFGGRAKQVFLYTTRAREAWLDSAWRHSLWGDRATQDFAAFCKASGKAADFATIVAQVTAAVPKAQVLSVALEAVATAPLGPAEAILRLLDLPDAVRAALTYPGIRNVGRTVDQSAALLALNRSNLSNDELKRQKRVLMSAADK